MDRGFERRLASPIVSRRSLILATAAVSFAGVFASTASAAPSVGGFYAGAISSGGPIVLQVSADGRQILRARTGVPADCSDGTSDYVPDGWVKLPLSAKGDFKRAYQDAPIRRDDGLRELDSGSIKGHLNPKTHAIHGTWTLSWTIVQADGSRISCKSGVIYFSAARPKPGRVRMSGLYGGFNSQGYPAVVKVSADGRRVDYISTLADLACSDGGSTFGADFWGKGQIPLSASGRFSLGVSNLAETYSDGSPFYETTSLSALINRAGRTVKGKWRIRWDTPQPDGSTVSCDSGQLSFTGAR